MTLSDHQWKFLKYVAKLIEYAEDNGYKLTGGELYRTADQQWMYYYGYKIENDELVKTTQKSKTMNSNHLKRLAIDFNIFKDNVLTYDVVDAELLGRYWESLDKKCKWGGNYRGWKDVPHFEYRV